MRVKNNIEENAFQRLKKLSRQERKNLIQQIESVSRKNGFLHRHTTESQPFPHPIALTPFIISPYLVKKSRKLAGVVYNFQLKLPRLYKNNFKNIRTLFPLDSKTKTWLLHHQEKKPEKLLIRLDATFGIDSQTKKFYPILFETNSTALAGLYNHNFGADLLKNSVWPKIFSQKERGQIIDPPNLLKFVYDWVKPNHGRKMAFIENSPIETDYGEIPRIAEYFKEKGVPVTHSHPDDLDLETDLIYRDLPYSKINPNNSQFANLMKKYRVLPGIASDFSHKGILECFSSIGYRQFFNPSEQKILKKSVPWTRVIWDRKTETVNGEKINLISYIKKEKKDLIIKPNLDAGGAGVVFGKDANGKCWDGLIQKAIQGPGQWVVQKAIESPTKKMAYLKNGQLYFSDCYFTFGIFYYPDKVGLHCRVSPFKVANVSRGGSLACVFMDKN